MPFEVEKTKRRAVDVRLAGAGGPAVSKAAGSVAYSQDIAERFQDKGGGDDAAVLMQFISFVFIRLVYYDLALTACSD
jgi:hypothetical protein